MTFHEAVNQFAVALMVIGSIYLLLGGPRARY